MRVLLLNQTFYPDQAATSQQLLDLARYLKASGCAVTVMASRRSYGDPRVIHPAEEWIDGIRIVRVGSTGFGRRSFFHRFVDGLSFEFLLLLRLLFFQRQDLVIAFTSPPLIGFAALLFCGLRGGKSVQWIMDLNPDIAFAVGYLKKNSLIGRVLTAIQRLTVRHSDFVVVLDRWMRQRMQAHGVRAEQLVVVPPWPIAKTPASDARLGERFKERHGIAGKFVILYSGNHSIAHPLDTVLESALLLREDPDVLFLFIGGGLREGDVTEFRKKHGLQNILQLPYQPRELLPESLSAADLHLVVMGAPMSGLVHVSKIYGVLAMGKPYAFVGPRASHIADLIDDCPYGFHVETGNVTGLVQVLEATRGLSEEQKAEVFAYNTRYVEERCSTAHSLTTFMSQVVMPLQTETMALVQLPSRA